MTVSPTTTSSHAHLYINERLYREAIEHLAGDLHGLVIDVGCGQAPYRPLLTGATKYVGIDTGHDRLADVVGDAQRLPVASDAAESILCTEVLEHVRDPDAVVREIFRILKPGGALLLTAPMSWNLHYEPNDFRRYTCYGLWQLLESHGFEIVETRRIGGLFSLVGSRLVDGIATELYARLRFVRGGRKGESRLEVRAIRLRVLPPLDGPGVPRRAVRCEVGRVGAVTHQTVPASD